MTIDPSLTRLVGADYYLVPKEGLRRLAARFTLGKQRYGAHNWKRGLDNQEFLDERKNHLVEHVFSYLEDGCQKDDNLAAIAWAAFCLMEAEKVAKQRLAEADLDTPQSSGDTTSPE